MPIPIIIAVLIALFSLGAKMNQKTGRPDRVVIAGNKQYNVKGEKDKRDTLVIVASEQNEHTIIIKGQRETASFENIFQLLGLYQIIKTEPLTSVNNSINSNMKQAVCLSEKE